VNPDLNADIYQLIEDADLDPEQKAKLERELGRQYHLITRDDRLTELRNALVAAKTLCSGHGVALPEIEQIKALLG
jgi:hypothetical protein